MSSGFTSRKRLPDPTILIEIEGGDYDGTQIRARKRVPLKEVFRYRRAIRSGETDDEGAPVYNEATAREWADTYLIDWNLDDAEGRPIPVSGDAFVSELPADLTDIIMEQWFNLLTGPDPNLPAPSSDGDTSAAELMSEASS